MRYTPFNIPSLLFDLMVSCAAFALGIFIAGTFIFLLSDSEGDLVYLLPTGIPLAAIVFYIIRRQFDLRTTLLQVLLSIVILAILAYPLLLLARIIPMGIPLILLLLIFVLTKHFSDRIIAAKRHKGRNNQ